MVVITVLLYFNASNVEGFKMQLVSSAPLIVSRRERTVLTAEVVDQLASSRFSMVLNLGQWSSLITEPHEHMRHLAETWPGMSLFSQ